MTAALTTSAAQAAVSAIAASALRVFAAGLRWHAGSGPVPPALAAHARRAVAACPTLALLLRREEDGTG